MRAVVKALVVFVVVALLLAQVSAATAVAPPGKGKPPKPANWTLLVYIDGDNNLDPYVTLDIETELAPTGSNRDVSVVALADRAASVDEWSETLLFYVTEGMAATPENAVANWGEMNMGDPQTLIDFIAWAKDTYPADHYALSFWNHGWSWRPGWSMSDDTDGDTLDQDEIEAALNEAGPIDVIMYDACNMATIENQATVRNASQAIIHSQEFVNWDGIEYELVIPALQEDPDMSAEELAVVINQSAGINKERTGSAVALNDDWDALNDAINEWAVALMAGLPDYRMDYHRSFQVAQVFWQDRTAKDLYDVADKIRNRVADPQIQATSEAVMKAVEAVVLDEWHTMQYHDAHGISIFVPTRVEDLDDPATELNEFEYYREELVFGRISQWDEFLDAYLNGQ